MQSEPEPKLEAEIARIRALSLHELRTLWLSMFRTPPPPAFTKDLIARFVSWHIQEQSIGGLDKSTARFLDGLARGDKTRFRRLKPGTVLVREYKGERHTVTVVRDGYLWQDQTSPASRPSPAPSLARPGMARGSSGCVRSPDEAGPAKAPALRCLYPQVHRA